MDKILEELEKLNEFNFIKDEYKLKKEELKQENKELEKLNEKVKLTALGSKDRVEMQKKYDDRKNKFIDLEISMFEINKKNLKEFEQQKNRVVSVIDEEMSKYKKSEEFNNLISQKNAYAKIAENSKKDIEKIISEINEGKDVDLNRLKAARGELKENSRKIEKIEKELEGYKSIEDNSNDVLDLDYLKMRIQSMNLDTMKNIKEDEFFKKYKKDKEIEKLDLEENEETKNEDNRNSNVEENKDSEEKTNLSKISIMKYSEQEKETLDDEKIEDSKTGNTKYKIVLDVDQNKIKINDNNDLFYKISAKNRGELAKFYSIKSYFITNKKQKKNIDYSLVDILQKIDDKENSLVESYLNVLMGGGLAGRNLEESVQKLKESVDIEYKFDGEMGHLTNFRTKKIARNANKLGIATLDGINENGLWDIIKTKFSKLKNTKFFKVKEEQIALNSGEKTNAQKDIEKVKQLIIQDRENLGEKTGNDYKEFHSKYETDEVVKKNVDDVAKKYKRIEEETEENRAKDIENIKNEEEFIK